MARADALSKLLVPEAKPIDDAASLPLPRSSTPSEQGSDTWDQDQAEELLYYEEEEEEESEFNTDTPMVAEATAEVDVEAEVENDDISDSDSEVEEEPEPT